MHLYDTHSRHHINTSSDFTLAHTTRTYDTNSRFANKPPFLSGRMSRRIRSRRARTATSASSASGPAKVGQKSSSGPREHELGARRRSDSCRPGSWSRPGGLDRRDFTVRRFLIVITVSTKIPPTGGGVIGPGLRLSGRGTAVEKFLMPVNRLRALNTRPRLSVGARGSAALTARSHSSHSPSEPR